MTRTIKARELGDEHIGARIQYTVHGWAVEGELEQVQGVTGYLSYLQAAGGLGALTVRRGDDVTILEEAPIRHPDEPTGLGAVVEAHTDGETPARWVCVVDPQGGVRWLRPETRIVTWYSWSGIQEAATTPIRVLSEGVNHGAEGDEPETPEVYEGMVITEWPENDEHLRGWAIEDYDGDEWHWEPGEGDLPDEHWRRGAYGLPWPICSPWKVLRKTNV